MIPDTVVEGGGDGGVGSEVQHRRFSVKTEGKEFVKGDLIAEGQR